MLVPSPFGSGRQNVAQRTLNYGVQHRVIVVKDGMNEARAGVYNHPYFGSDNAARSRGMAFLQKGIHASHMYTSKALTYVSSMQNVQAATEVLYGSLSNPRQSEL